MAIDIFAREICCIACAVCEDRNYDRNRIHFPIWLALFRWEIPSLGKSLRNVGILKGSIALWFDVLSVRYYIFSVVWHFFTKNVHTFNLKWSSFLWFSFFTFLRWSLVRWHFLQIWKWQFPIPNSSISFPSQAYFTNFFLHIVNMSEFGNVVIRPGLQIIENSFENT